MSAVPGGPAGQALEPEPRGLPSDVRVAFFSDSIPERNGTGAYYYDLAEQLAPQVGALEVLQPEPGTTAARFSLPMPGDPLQRLFAPNLRRISRRVRALAPHLVVAITPGPYGLLGLRTARRHRAGFVTAFHTEFEELARLYWNPVARRFVSGYLRWVNRILCSRSDAVLINNSQLRPTVEELGARQVEVLGTPIQSAFLERPLTAAPEGIESVCFAGRLAAEKNVHLVVEAATELPAVDFVIAGDGPLRAELERQARDCSNVRFTGWLSRGELIDLIDRSSLLLLPSQVETFGSVALEAMARGRPALVSANAGIQDWPALRRVLFTWEPRERLPEAIRRLQGLDPDQWRNRSAEVREAAEAHNRRAVAQWVRFLDRHASRERD